jgi:hypothetical protein
MEHLNELSNYLIKQEWFKFNQDSIQELKSYLNPNLTIPQEIEELLIHFGGLFFKSNSYLATQEGEFELLHVMGDSYESVQKNLISFVKNNPNKELLPIIKLRIGFVFVRLSTGDQFGNIYIGSDEVENTDFTNLEDLIRHMSIKSEFS